MFVAWCPCAREKERLGASGLLALLRANVFGSELMSIASWDGVAAQVKEALHPYTSMTLLRARAGNHFQAVSSSRYANLCNVHY